MTLTTNAPPARTLADATLGAAPLGVRVPGYDRRALLPGVVHMGVGGFHRAHQALYLDELAERGETDWGVVGVGLHTSEMHQVLSSQDNLFTVVQRGADGEEARIVGVVVDYLFAPQQPDAVLAALADPRVKLVTLTVTGAGYPVDPATGEFRADLDEEVAADLRTTGAPVSVFGFLVEALRLRREAGVAPFTVLSCDNVAQNGRTTAAAVCGFARQRDAGLADWIEQHVTFPSSMVDRITPATSQSDRDEIVERLGIEDGWPVITEPFSQWVIEDRFCNDRPPLDAVGVQFVADVRPYELMKTRLLNGGHCALGSFGLLLGYECSADAMDDAQLRSSVAALMDQVIPLLPPVGGVDLQEYRNDLLTRFANPRVGDRLDRLAGRGSTKLASYVVPSIAEARRRGTDRGMLTATVAAWIHLLAQTRGPGDGVPVQDPLRDRLAPYVARGDVRGVLAQVPGFAVLADDVVVQAEIADALDRLVADGPRAVLRAAVSGR